MLRWLSPLIVVVPLAELYLLVVLGRRFGLGPIIALLVLTALFGSAVARYEGLRVWKQWLTSLRELRSPAEPLLESVLILLGGVLLVLPGILTDFCGLLLLLPLTRRLFARPLRRAVEAHIAHRAVDVLRARQGTGPSPPAPPSPGVLDTTGESVNDPLDAPSDPPSASGDEPRLP